MKNEDNNIMLDLETMGTDSHSAIVSIGAVRFTSGGILDSFYCVVDLQSCVNAGLVIDASTVMWWMKQGESARSQFVESSLPLTEALTQLANWMGLDAVVWGNGSSFDNAILSNAYKAANVKQPWKFWNDRCYRTIKSLNKDVEFERTGTHHNAVDDAVSQAKHLIKIWKTKG